MKERKQEGCFHLEAREGRGKEADTQYRLSFESSRSLAVDHVEETSQESPREIQDVHAGTAMGGRGEDAWRLEPQGERETMETKVVSDGWKASAWTLIVKVTMGASEKFQNGKVKRQEKKVKKIESPKMIVQVDSEETQDCVREANDVDQKESEQMSFVPSAISVPQKPLSRETISVANRPSASGSLRRW